MDFVVFGFGLGAILMLVGFALRDLGPWLFGSTQDDDALPEFEGIRTTIRKQILSSIGNAISVGGAGVAVVTFAALLAKAEDDLGAIVVGMSLVLATVGVGAWSYDVFRRYRAAMDIVAVQEQAVRQRLAPRQKRRRPKPAPPQQPAVQPNAPEPTELPAPDEELAAAASAEPDAAEGTPEQPSADDEQSLQSSDSESGAPSSIERPMRRTESPESDQRALADNDLADVDDETFFANLEFHPETRVHAPEADAVRPDRDQDSTSPARNSEPFELPPLPEEPDDALIDESVRFEPRPEPKRTVPSWLFEDLESDLASTGPSRPADPIDHFHDATPMPRPSALDRLLAGEDEQGNQSSPSAEEPPRRRPANRPTTRDDD